ncbi:MAG: cyclase family protein [Candidatus Binataceae bacterium]
MAPRLTIDEVIATFEKISNWGRWGKDDERGALNLITAQKRMAAARLVRSGESVSLALPLATVAAADNPMPVTHLMAQVGYDADKLGPLPYSADYFAIAPHGHAITHLDALCHVFWQGKMYNGFDASEVGSHGARKCAIDVASDGVVSRGVLLDIPKIKNAEWMEPGDRIFPEDLESAERDHRVRVEEGDVLLIRTGRARRRKSKGPWNSMQEGLPGLDASCLQWLHDRGVALLGSDSTSDVVPSGYDRMVRPIHVGTLVIMGIHLIDNADFDAVAATAARLGRYEFQFVMGPLILKRGTASPVNPLAIF